MKTQRQRLRGEKQEEEFDYLYDLHNYDDDDDMCYDGEIEDEVMLETVLKEIDMYYDKHNRRERIRKANTRDDEDYGNNLLV